MNYFEETSYKKWKLKDIEANYLKSQNYQEARDSVKKDLEAITSSDKYNERMRNAAQRLLDEWIVSKEPLLLYFLKTPG
jgi:hypothetical protein